MGHIEYTNILPDGLVFGQDGLVLNRHVPAAEIDEPGTQRSVLGVEWRVHAHPVRVPRASRRVTTGFPGSREGAGTSVR